MLRLLLLDEALLKSDLHKYVEYITYEKAFGQDFEDMIKRKPNTDKISELTGWSTTINLDNAIERIVDYFCEN